VKVAATGFARVMLNVYDDAEVEVDCSEMAKVYVYRHSESSKVKSIGENEILIRNEG
jgi:hypothetical protein